MTSTRIRREPPHFRRLEVRRTETISPYMTRVTLGGPELDGFRLAEPAASVRLLLPTGDELVIPTWRGNEFLHLDGSRAIIRTLTPRRFDAQRAELDLDIVLHRSGFASAWAQAAEAGTEAAVSGPGRGYHIDPTAKAYLLLGDETAIPAICQLLEHLPDVSIAVHIALRHAEAQVDLHRDVDASWYVMADGSGPTQPLSNAIIETDIVREMRIWAAGEAAEMQRIRKQLFNERGFSRSHATIRGYWQSRNGSDDQRPQSMEP